MQLFQKKMSCSYLVDMFGHGVIIQSGFRLELLLALLALQGILQLKTTG